MALVTQGLAISAGQSMSTSIGLSGANKQFMAIIMPPAWDPAPITFPWSNDNGSWYDLFDRFGKEIAFAFVPNAVVPIQSLYGFYIYPYIQVRSGSRSQAIPQSASRQFILVSM